MLITRPALRNRANRVRPHLRARVRPCERLCYDANRHAQTAVSDADEGSKITYLHNALGRPVFKSEPQVAQLAPNAATFGTGFVDWLRINFTWMFAQANATLGQSFVYDGGQLGSNPVLLGEYGNGGSQSAGRSEYIWLPLADGSSAPVGLYTNGALYHIHTDRLNTSRVVTLPTNPSGDFTVPYGIVWQLPYSAFGDAKPTGVFSAVANAAAPMALKSAPQHPRSA